MDDNQTINEQSGICRDFCDGQLTDSISQQYINYFYPEKDNFTIPNKSVLLLTSGRLGNQFSEYAAAYSLAKKTDSRLYLFDQDCASCYLKKDPSVDVDYYLTKFNLSKDTIIIPNSENSRSLIKKFYPRNYSFKNNSTPEELLELNAEYVKGENYYELIKYKNEKILVIADYLINPNYFKDFTKEITEQFVIPNFDTSNIDDILEKVRQNNSVCIHFRGTDYLKYYKFIPMDYQKAAIKLIESEKLLENPNYFVVTDDVKEAKLGLQEYSDIQFIDKTTTLEALYILSNCRNNIITTSSFSWWAAFLNLGNKFTIVQCNYFDIYKENHLTYKIQYQLNGTDQCLGVYAKSGYLMQYKDDEGKKISQNENGEWVVNKN